MVPFIDLYHRVSLLIQQCIKNASLTIHVDVAIVCKKGKESERRKEMEQQRIKDKDRETDRERKTERERSESWGQKNSQR